MFGGFPNRRARCPVMRDDYLRPGGFLKWDKSGSEITR